MNLTGCYVRSASTWEAAMNLAQKAAALKAGIGGEAAELGLAVNGSQEWKPPNFIATENSGRQISVLLAGATEAK